MFSIESESEPETDRSALDLDRLALIVVGVQPMAEKWDRPLAYRLQQQIQDWQRTFCDEPVIEPTVLTDVWYLNHRAFETRPVISLGSPRYNALTAYLTDKVPVAYASEEHFLIQVDDDVSSLQVCVWGSDAGQTEKAVDAFLERFLDDWLERVIAQVSE